MLCVDLQGDIPIQRYIQKYKVWVNWTRGLMVKGYRYMYIYIYIARGFGGEVVSDEAECKLFVWRNACQRHLYKVEDSEGKVWIGYGEIYIFI